MRRDRGRPDAFMDTIQTSFFSSFFEGVGRFDPMYRPVGYLSRTYSKFSQSGNGW